MITSGPNTFLFDGDDVFIVGVAPARCACGRVTHLFKNRNGKTLCLGCEAPAMMVAPSESDVADDGPDAATALQKAIV